jgi:type III pantothenate kinase
MILLIDIGNSRTKYILADEISNEKAKGVNNDCISVEWLDSNFKEIKKIIIASVSADSILNLIIDWATINLIQFKLIESETKAYGVISSYQHPKQLGIDRWLAMIGAATLYSNKNILIIDAGTATTIDLLSAQGQHYGGWILPGIHLMFDSLVKHTSKINTPQALIASVAFGDDTDTNVNNACWAATIGAINLAIIQASRQLTIIDVILLTGGNASSVEKLLEYPSIIEDNLIFYGLERYNLA